MLVTHYYKIKLKINKYINYDINDNSFNKIVNIFEVAYILFYVNNLDIKCQKYMMEMSKPKYLSN